MKKEDLVNEIVFYAVLFAIVAFLSSPFILIFAQPIFEARVYEKATGIKATYWEAFFCDLDESAHNLQLEHKYPTHSD